jgi:hypothetical protein
VVSARHSSRRHWRYLRLGASRQTAAHANGIGKATLSRWIAESAYAPRFYEAVLEAESAGSIKALKVVSTERENHPRMAWRYLERREPGYAPPQPHVPAVPASPVVIQLSLSDGTVPALPEPVIEDEVEEARRQDAPPRSHPQDDASELIHTGQALIHRGRDNRAVHPRHVVHPYQE